MENHGGPLQANGGGVDSLGANNEVQRQPCTTRGS